MGWAPHHWQAEGQEPRALCTVGRAVLTQWEAAQAPALKVVLAYVSFGLERDGHLAPVRPFFPPLASPCPMAPWSLCSMLTLRQDIHCMKMVFAEQNVSGLLLVLMQQLLWHCVFSSQRNPFGCEGAGDQHSLLPGITFPLPPWELPSSQGPISSSSTRSRGGGLEGVPCGFISLPGCPSHLPPGHTFQKHGLRGAEFLWVRAVGDTAIALTLRIVSTHLSDPLKHPGFVHLRQGTAADPVPRGLLCLDTGSAHSDFLVLTSLQLKTSCLTWNKGKTGVGRVEGSM